MPFSERLVSLQNAEVLFSESTYSDYRLCFFPVSTPGNAVECNVYGPDAAASTDCPDKVRRLPGLIHCCGLSLSLEQGEMTAKPSQTRQPEPCARL